LSGGKEKSLVALLNDLFIGGFQTTGLTLVWMVLFLVKYPEIQEKMFQEVKETVGLQNLPTLADRSK
jgi:cytochrome P450